MGALGRFLAIFGCWYLTWAQPLDGSISLTFSLETRLESAFFETLINFLAFCLPYLLAYKTGIFPRDFGLKLGGPSYR